MSSAASAGDLSFKVGTNLPKANDLAGNTKAAFVAYRDHTYGPLVYQFEFGGWVDRSGHPGRRSSMMLSATCGPEVQSGPFYARITFGLAVITHPDSALGGPLQFNTDAAAGIRDERWRWDVGVGYKHVSSGDLYQPNVGRDFPMMEIKFAL